MAPALAFGFLRTVYLDGPSPVCAAANFQVRSRKVKLEQLEEMRGLADPNATPHMRNQ